MNSTHRVTFGPGAFVLGAGITVALFGIPLGATGYVFGTAARHDIESGEAGL